MSKSKKLILVKRCLAMFLAVAMMVTMMPVNASAAPVTSSVVDQTEENTEVVESVEESAEETVSEAADLLAETTTTTEASTETAAPDMETLGTETSNEESETEVAPAMATQIALTYAEEARTTTYTGAPVFPTLLFLRDYLDVTVDGKDVDYNVDDVTLAWSSVGADGVLTALAVDKVPVDAGTYNLSVKLAAREGAYQAAEIAGGVTFTIEPVVVKVEAEVGSAAPGSKVKDLELAVTVNSGVFAYILDDPETTGMDESVNSDIAVTYSVRNVKGDTVLGADEILVATEDYMVDFAVSFTEEGAKKAGKNYVLTEIKSQDLEVESLINTKVDITLAEAWAEAGKITTTYTGSEIAAPVKTTDYTAVVIEDNNADEPVEITDAATTEAWYALTVVKEYVDAEGNARKELAWQPMESAPVDAGTYAYRISYAGQDGIYKESYTDITVVIEPMPVVIKPILVEDAKFYHSMEEKDALSQIDYNVVDMEGTAVEGLDKATAWGVSYDDNYYETQSFEPVFVLQYEKENEDGSKIFVDNEGAALDIEKTYRVIFSGYKAVYFDDGTMFPESYLPINEVVNSIEMNYMVDTDYENTLSKNATEVLTIEKAYKTTIDVSKIIDELDGKGTGLGADEIYTKVYDGNGLHKEKADYKKAIVMADVDGKATQAAEGTEPSISYRWYKNVNSDLTDNVFDDNTNEPYADAEDNTYNNEENWKMYGNGTDIPYKPGVYRLTITYKDDVEKGYLESSAYVYYVIEKQPVKAVFNSEYKALTGMTINDFWSDFNYNDISLVTIGKDGTTTPIELNRNEDYWINLWIEKTNLVETYDENENKVFVPATNSVIHYCFASDGTYYQVIDKDGNVVKEEAVEEVYGDEIFTENAVYKIAVDLEFEDYYDFSAEEFGSRYIEYYTDDKYVVEELNLKADKTDTHTVRSIENLNEKAPITVEKMGDVELDIVVDSDKLGELEKEYDGETFDLNSLLKEGAVKVIKVADGSEVTDVELDYSWYGTHYVLRYDEDSREYYYDEYEDTYWNEAVHAGNYTLVANFPGSTVYRPLSKVITDVEITAKEISIATNDDMVFVAGMTAGSAVSSAVANSVVEGEIAKDSASMEDFYDIETPYAWNYFTYEVYNADGENVSNSKVLKGDKEYTLKLECVLNNPYALDYEIKSEDVTFTTVRGNSEVASLSGELYKQYLTHRVEEEAVEVAVEDTINGLEHTIVAKEAIPYSYHTQNGDKEYGHYVALKIAAPAEYRTYGYYDSEVPDSAKYVNDIEKAGGIVWPNEGGYSNYIYVILDASSKDVKTFDIRWEDGYTERFNVDFTNAELMGDLTQAVAPKTIKFNSPSKKMQVGEEQELDLVLTKTQMNDIICIAYSVDNEEVMSVDEYGKVTALKKGSATVTAYPVYVVDGQKIAIPNAKKATVKITVSDVTAPKIQKLDAKDNYFGVKYSRVADGYRREIYVMEGKGWKKDAFETKIAAMKNEDWNDHFAVAPWFVYPEDEEWVDEVDKGFVYPCDGLKPATDYTVYVRNVSAIRTLEDGSQVALSYSGNTKSFKTTKPQLDSLRAKPVNGEKSYDEDGNWNEWYDVKLSSGKDNLLVEGTFEAGVLNGMADYDDFEWYELPLNKELQRDYLNPKLTYSIISETEWYENYYGEYPFMVDPKIASVNKKGQVSFKGVGLVAVKIADANQPGIEEVVVLNICADADKVTGKKVSLTVGQTVALEDMLTYYEGRKKLTGDYVCRVVVDDALKAAFEGNEYFRLNAYAGTVTAIKAGGKLKVSLTDRYVQKNEGIDTAEVTLSSKALVAVKGLKILKPALIDMEVWENYKSNVYYAANQAALVHNQARVQFTYDEKGGASHFKIEVKDGRNNIISSSYVSRAAMDSANTFIGTDGKEYYLYYIGGLTQQSKYSVTVTAVYGDYSAKAAKVNVKTTKIPATVSRIAKGYYGGTYIDITAGNRTYDIYDVSDNMYLISGNKYSMRAYADIALAETSGSDSLIWTSSNKKVATVKTTSGTYNATLTAVKTGTTTIELKSKVTKEVIARYKLTVKSVGDAYEKGRRFFGENPTDNFDPITIPGVKLKVGDNNIQVKGKNSTWAEFTAPTDGLYNFDVYNFDFKLHKTFGDEGTDTYMTKLAAKETVYLEIFNPYGYASTTGVEVTNMPVKELTLGEHGTKGFSDERLVLEFTAPADSVYRFETEQVFRKLSCQVMTEGDYGFDYLYDDEFSNEPLQCSVELKKDQTAYIVMNGCTEDGFDYTVKAFGTAGITADSETVVKAAEDSSEMIIFTAPETNVYTISAKSNVEKKSAAVAIRKTYAGRVVENLIVDENEKSARPLELQKDEKVYLTVSGEPGTEAADVTLKITKGDTLTVGSEKSVELAGDKEVRYAFTATEDGYYKFAVQSDNTDCVVKLSGNGSNTVFDAFVDGKTSKVFRLSKDQTVNLYITNNNAEKAANLKVNVTKETMTEVTLGTDVPVTVKAGETKYLKFTVAETGGYKFVTKVAENATAEGTISAKYAVDNTTAFNGSLSDLNEMKVLKAEDVLFMEVTATADSEFTFNVSGEKAVTQGQTVKLEAGNSEWLSFTAAEEGTYRFAIQGLTDSDATYFNTYFYNADEDVENFEQRYLYPVYDANGLYIIEINAAKGEEVIGKFVNNTVDNKETEEVESTSLFFTILTTDALAYGKETALDLAEGVGKLYKFTAPEAGDYDFEVQRIDETSVGRIVLFDEDMINAVLADATETGTAAISDHTLERNEKIYLYVTSADNKASKLKVSVSKTGMETLTVGTDVTVSMKKGDVKYYTFTADKAGVYTIASKATAANDTAQGTISVSNPLSRAGAESSELLKFNVESLFAYGEERLLEITATEDSKFVLTVAESKEILTEATPITVSGNDIEWVSFTAPSSGDYIFEVENGTSEEVVTGATYTGFYQLNYQGQAYDIYNNTADVSGMGTSREYKYSLVKGQEYLWNLENTFDGVASTISVQKMSVLGEDSTEKISLKEGEHKWFSFTAPEAGTYRFVVNRTDETSTSEIGLYGYINSSSYWSKAVNDEQGNATIKYSLSAGRKIFLLVNGTDLAAAELQLTASMVEAESLYAGIDKKVSMKAGEVNYYKFESPKTSAYKFTSEVVEGKKATGQIKVMNYLNANWNEGMYDITALDYNYITNSRNVKYLEVSATEDSEFVLSVSEAEVLTTETPVTVSGNDVEYFVFTVAEDGAYRFTSEVGENGSGSVELYNSKDVDWSFMDLYASGAGNVVLSKGDVIICRVNNYSETAAITLAVEKITELKVGSDETLKLDAGKGMFYVYEATKDGLYRFAVEQTNKPSEDAVVSYGIDIYSETRGRNLGSSRVSEGIAYVESVLSAGDLIYVYVDNAGSEKVDLKVSVSRPVAEVLNAGTDCTVELKAGETKYYRFVAEEAYAYAFKSIVAKDATAEGSIDMIWDSGRTKNYQPDSMNAKYLFREDEGCYINVTADKDLSLTLNVSKVDADLTVEKNVTVSGNATEYVVFTVPATAFYAIDAEYGEDKENLNPSAEGTLYRWDTFSQSFDYVNGININPSESYPMFAKEGEKYFFELDMKDSHSIPLTFSVNMSEELELNNSISVSGNSVEYIKFTAPEAGMYYFEAAYGENAKNEILSANIVGYQVNGDMLSTVFDNAVTSEIAKLYRLYMDENQSYIWRIERTDKAAVSLNFKVDRTQDNLEVDNSVSVVTAPYAYEYIDFVAPEAGIYSFDAEYEYESESYYLRSRVRIYSINDEDGTLLQKHSDTIYENEPTEYAMYLNRGEHIRVELYRYDYAKVPVCVEVTKVPELEAGTSVSLIGNTTGWYQFTATETDMYNFTVAYDNEENYNYSYVYLYELDEETGTLTQLSTNRRYFYGSYAWEHTMYMNAGKCIYMKVVSNAGENAQINVKAKKVSELEDDVVTSLLGNMTEWYKFTATETDMYNFTAVYDNEENYNDSYVYLYELDEETGTLTQLSTNRSYFYGSYVWEHTMYMNAGKCIYIKVVGNAGESTQINVKAKKVSELEDGVVVSLLGNTTEWYKFTATGDGLYKFATAYNSQDDSNNSYVYLYELDEETGTLIQLSTNRSNFYGNYAWEHTMYMNADECMYMKVVGNAEETVQINVSANTIVPTIIESGNTETAEGNTTEWLQFTAAEDGLYNFIASYSSTDDYNDSYVYLYELNEETGDLTQINYNSFYGNYAWEYIMYINAGKCMYMKVVGNAEETVQINVAVNAIVPTVLENGNTVTLAGNTTNWLKFTAAEKNLYDFIAVYSEYYSSSSSVKFYQLNEETGILSNIYIYPYSFSGSTVWEQIRNMDENECIYMKVEGNASEETQINVTVNLFEPTVLEPDNVETVAGNTTNWFAFTVPETDVYSITVAYDVEDYSSSNVYLYELSESTGQLSQITSGSLYSSNAWEYSNYMNAGKKLYMKVRGNASEATQINVATNLLASAVLAEGNTETVTGNTTSWFKFTIPESNWYSFTAAYNETYSGYSYVYLYELNESIGQLSEISNSYGNIYGSTTWEYSNYINAGKDIYVKVEGNASETTQINVAVNTITPTALAAGNTENIAGDTTNWFVFTVPETGVYSITTSYSESVYSYSYIYLYEFSENTGQLSQITSGNLYSSNAWEYSNYMNAGKTIYMKVQGKASTETQINVAANMASVTLEEGNSEVVAGNTVSWFKFTIPESDWYSFTAAYNEAYSSYSYVYLYELNESTGQLSQITSGNLYSSTAWEYSNYMNAGKEIYIKVQGNASEATQINVAANTITPSALVVGNTEIIAGNTTKWFSFTVPETDMYSITAAYDEAYSGYSYVYLYELNESTEQLSQISNSSSNIYGSNAWEYNKMDAGKTLYMKVQGRASAETQINVSVKQITNNVFLGDASVISGTPVSFEFTAPIDGVYVFYSTDNNGDPYGWLYDSNDNELSYNDDGNGNSNFKIAYTLSAGEVVRLDAGEYGSNGNATYKVYVMY